MKSLTSMALYVCSFAALAEEAEKPIEQTGPMGVVLFFAVVVAACVWFFISMNKASKKDAADKASKTK